MKTFNIFGKITLSVDFEMIAENEEQAYKEGIERINDFFTSMLIRLCEGPVSWTIVYGWTK